MLEPIIPANQMMSIRTPAKSVADGISRRGDLGLTFGHFGLAASTPARPQMEARTLIVGGRVVEHIGYDRLIFDTAQMLFRLQADWRRDEGWQASVSIYFRRSRARLAAFIARVRSIITAAAAAAAGPWFPVAALTALSIGNRPVLLKATFLEIPVLEIPVLETTVAAFIAVTAVLEAAVLEATILARATLGPFIERPLAIGIGAAFAIGVRRLASRHGWVRRLHVGDAFDRRSKSIHAAAEVIVLVGFVGIGFAGLALKALGGLRRGNQTEIMLGVLKKALSHHRVAGRLRVARQLQIFFANMMRRAPDFDIRAVGLVAAR